MILSECVYKLVDIGDEESAKAATTFMAQFPPGMVRLQHIQSTDTLVPHRFAKLQPILHLIAPCFDCMVQYRKAIDLLTLQCLQVHAGG